jgi:superfamily II DNA or RNA helicase
MHRVEVDKIKVNNVIEFHEDDVTSAEGWQNNYVHFDKDLKRYTTLTYDEKTGFYTLPSNAWWTIDYKDKEDLRNYPHRKELKFSATLRKNQQEVVDTFLTTSSGIPRSGIVNAPPAWGKTFVGTYLISKAKTRCLILVHTKLLFRQWEKELKEHIPDIDIGLIGDGTYKIRDVTIGLYISVRNRVEKLQNEFGLVIVDESHHAPADTFQITLGSLNAKVKIGMTATMVRKDGKHIILPEYFTSFVSSGTIESVYNITYQVHNTPFKFEGYGPPKKWWAKELTKLGANKKYLEYIAAIAREDIKAGRTILIIGARLNMLHSLHSMIKTSVLLVGSTKENERVEILENIGKKYNTVLSTTIFDEGVSAHILDTIYFVSPFNNIPLLTQRVGRIEREHLDKKTPLIRDFWLQGMMLYNQQLKRLNYYEEKGYINVGMDN